MKDSKGNELNVGDLVESMLLSDDYIGKVVGFDGVRLKVGDQYGSGNIRWFYQSDSKYLTRIEEPKNKPMKIIAIEIPVKELGEKVLKELFALDYQWHSGGEIYRPPTGYNYLAINGNNLIEYGYVSTRPVKYSKILSYSDFMEEAKKRAKPLPLRDMRGHEVRVGDRIVFTYTNNPHLFEGVIKNIGLNYIEFRDGEGALQIHSGDSVNTNIRLLYDNN